MSVAEQVKDQQRPETFLTGRSGISSFMAVPGNLTDLNKYCEALLSMLAESVPDVQAFLDEVSCAEDDEPRPAYEMLVYAIEVLISVLPSHSKTLQMVKNL